MTKNFYSPLRYPGGKNKLAKFVAEICVRNNVNGHYVEPYAGGASVALYLLLNGYVKRITINDVDRAIYAFWYSVVNHTDELCRRIEEAEITLETREKCRKILKRKKAAGLLDLGFSTFFLNRTNVSGILDGGVIGGLEQKGSYKIDCRFNKKALIKRIRAIAERAKDIDVRNLDALELIEDIQKRSRRKSNVIFYFDPPYYLKGSSLYLNHYEHDDHEKVSRAIQSIQNVRWIVSYDDTPEIRKMYRKSRSASLVLSHTARERRQGKEVVFFSVGLKVPRVSRFVNA